MSIKEGNSKVWKKSSKNGVENFDLTKKSAKIERVFMENTENTKARKILGKLGKII